MSQTNIWLPGLGNAPTYVHQAAQAVKEYDPDLALARDEHDAWVIYLKTGPEGRAFPVFNLGHELPPPEAIKARLYRADVRRRGREIIRDVERNNERRRKELRDAAHDAAGEVAESVEWALRKMGQTKHTKVFMPGEK